MDLIKQVTYRIIFVPQSWFPKAQELLDSLTTHHSGGPFLQPVDTTMYKVCVCVCSAIRSL